MMAAHLFVYVVAGLGLGIGIFRAVMVMRWNLNLPAFTAAIVKLIRSDNWDRALKLCGAAPSVLFVRMVEPALRAGQGEKSGGLYRATAMREAYRESKARALAPDRFGPLLSAGGAALPGGWRYGIGVRGADSPVGAGARDGRLGNGHLLISF